MTARNEAFALAIETLTGMDYHDFMEAAILARESGDSDDVDVIELIADRLIDARIAGEGIAYAMRDTAGISRAEFVGAARQLATNRRFVAAVSVAAEAAAGAYDGRGMEAHH